MFYASIIQQVSIGDSIIIHDSVEDRLLASDELHR